MFKSLLYLSYIVTSLAPGPTPSRESLEHQEISGAVQALDSEFFLERAWARQQIEAVGDQAIEVLARTFEEASSRGRVERLELLSDLVPDSACNRLAWESLEARSPLLRLAAIRYLAGHPESGSPDYVAWSGKILNGGETPEVEAYLAGVKNNALPVQTDLIAGAGLLLDPALAEAALEAIAKGWRLEVSRTLNRIVEAARAGRLSQELILPAMRRLGDAATESACPAVLYGLTSGSPVLQGEASRALQGAYRHLFRARAFDELVRLYGRVHQAFPLSMDLALDHCDALIQYGTETARAEDLLGRLRPQVASRSDTLSRMVCCEIDLGLALCAFRSEGDWRAPLDRESFARIEEEGCDPAKRVRARKALLHGALELLDCGDDRGRFAEALKTAPYDPDWAEIDALFTGRFSLSNLIWRLNRSGRTEASLAVLGGLVRALREDRYYFPDPAEAEAYSDRIRSRIPLHEAWVLMHHGGDPEAALKKIDAFILLLKDSTHPGNLEHLGIAYYHQGLARLDLDRLDGAGQSVENGIKTYEQLEEAYKEGWQSAATEAAIRHFRRERARGYLYQETLNVYGEANPGESGRLVRKAVETAPDFDEALVALAMVQARRGRFETARDLLPHLEPYADRLYNLACLNALIGDKETALSLLERHFDAYVPKRRRPIERRYALRDPDLRSLRDDPRFKALIQD